MEREGKREIERGLERGRDGGSAYLPRDITSIMGRKLATEPRDLTLCDTSASPCQEYKGGERPPGSGAGA